MVYGEDASRRGRNSTGRRACSPWPRRSRRSRVAEIAGPQLGLLRGGGERRSFRLGRRARTLPYFDDGVYRRIVIAPVGSHAGVRAMRRANAVVFLQIREKDGAGVELPLLLFAADVEDRHATLHVEKIAVPVGIVHAALGAIECREKSGDVEHVRCLLNSPPGVFLAARLMVSDDAEVETRGVHPITVGIP